MKPPLLPVYKFRRAESNELLHTVRVWQPCVTRLFRGVIYLLTVTASKISGTVAPTIDSVIRTWAKLEVRTIISLSCRVSTLRLSNVLSRVVTGKKTRILPGMSSKAHTFVFNVLQSFRLVPPSRLINPTTFDSDISTNSATTTAAKTAPLTQWLSMLKGRTILSSHVKNRCVGGGLVWRFKGRE